VSATSVSFDGKDLMDPRTLGAVRGREIGVVFQDALRSLNPAYTVGNQVAEVARRHLGLTRRQAWSRAVEMLDAVGIRDAARRARDYPHQFSGGMSQRVMIAMALVCEPRLLIADEPTTALDVTVQRGVLRLLARMQREMGLAVLFITHDLGVVASMCDEVMVMYAGKVVEHADVEDLFVSPRHPYTAGLLDAIPDRRSHKTFGFIPGVVPNPLAWPSGCRFHPRCAHATEICRTRVPEPVARAATTVSCHRVDELTLEGIPDGSP
jgi:oligopeptide/dipeptide ABC transporter ATP-binding protein